MKSRALLVLLVLCAAALGLRLRGLDFLLPHRMEPDGEIVAQVRLIDAPDRDEDWQFGTYGLLTAYLARALPEPAPAGPDASLEELLEESSWEVVRVRLVVALLSLLLIPATYRLARRALERPAALFAAALAATSLLHLSMAQQARPHSAATGVYLVAVLSAVCLRRRPTWGAYALAGVTAGLSIGILHSGVAVLIPLAAAHLLRERGERPTGFARVLLPAAIVAGLFALFYPFVFSESVSSVHLDSEVAVVQQSGHEIDLTRFNGGGFAKVLWTLWAYDPLILVLAGVGLVLAWRRAGGVRGIARQRDLLIVLSFAVPYLLAIGSFEQTQERFVLPLVPYLAVLAAFAADGLLRLAAGRPGARPVAATVLLALLAIPASFAWRLSSVRRADDTFEQAAHWIEANLDADRDTVLVMFPVQLPLLHDRESLALLAEKVPDQDDFYPIATRWLRQELYRIEPPQGPGAPERWRLLLGGPRDLDPGAGSDAAEHLRELGVTHVVVELFPPERGVVGGTEASEALRRLGRRVARFAPWSEVDSSDLPYEHEGLPSHPRANVVGYLRRAERFGPVLEIYDVR